MGFMDRVKKFLGISTNDDIVAKPVEEPVVKLHNTEDGYKFEYADTNKEDKDENDNVKEFVQTSEYDALIDKAKNKILAGINKGYKTTSIRLPARYTHDEAKKFADTIKYQCSSLVKKYRIRPIDKNSKIYNCIIFYIRNKDDAGYNI